MGKAFAHGILISTRTERIPTMRLQAGHDLLEEPPAQDGLLFCCILIVDARCVARLR